MISGLGKLGTPWLPWILSGEHRHNTCISGGAKDTISVGRLLRSYSPDLAGLNYYKTRVMSSGSGFNFARSGSTVDALTDQVTALVNKLARPEYAHLAQKWKMVVIWIGGNDLFVRDSATITETFPAALVRALRRLKALVPNCFVSLLTLPDLSNARPGALPAEIESTRRRGRLVNTLIRSTVADYHWDCDTFRVVVQPIPEEDIGAAEYKGFKSMVDGLHPNVLAHQLFAKAVWTNLFRAEGEKLTTYEDVIMSEWVRPGPDTYFL
ncbi:SGNH hydrolase-type esterase domain-containing protein [Blyttiomyces helicus]|uniref:SGNH hydrolase-type esterase domain-containing protein n=1 Tax=Blyttiomyces helicus TaxID=388810 RepID=A0A4P9W0Z1_9FUNG|nr:SGNH hydrolase-type esterase domain-containing protein [Blyttiomyces helicus]|eukprot:RKO85764.1 SGNH hydrolase-type esterase domain-containing protein [Blyttiomyces helicus]